MIYLLDVNVLIALLDDHHIDHDRATSWFETIGHKGWATCPIVENGVVRILGSASYAAAPFDCGEVVEILSEWCSSDGRQFWPDDISLVASSSKIDRKSVSSPGRITDAYLLALAAHRDGKLATLDRRLSADGVADGQQALHLIQ